MAACRMAISLPPFPKEHELNGELALVEGSDGKAWLTNAGNEGAPYLPGHPQVSLRNDCLAFLKNEILTPELDIISPYLWLVATQRSDHVSALHHQLVRGRTIMITENPKLHLLWIDNRVYIKPIPSYLLNHAFWVYAFSPQYSPFASDVRNLLSRSALGYLRTYVHLIRHESDFGLAKERCLIPSSTSWRAWNAFTFPLRDVVDTEVSARYRYGELRLTRLNFWGKIFLGRMSYFRVTGQTSTYLARFFAPLIFIWATFSVILAAMQVELSVQQIYNQDSKARWTKFAYTSRWFSVAVLVITALGILTIVVLICARLMSQLIFASNDLSKKHRNPASANGHGRIGRRR